MSLELGTAHTRYADSVAAAAVSISPTLRATGNRGSFTASGTLAQLGGAWTNSGTLDASVFPTVGSRLSTELEGIAGGSSHADGTRTGQLLALARLHVKSDSYGAWFGAGLGRTWDGAWRAVAQGDAGAWLASGATVASISVAPTVFDDTIKYTDGFLSLSRSLATWDMNASLGVRAGGRLPSLPSTNMVWGGISATRWATRGIGVVASAGTYPVDFTQGFPGGQYVSLGIRFTSRRLAPGTVQPLSRAREAPEIRAFQIQRVNDSAYRIEVRAPNARKVELAGDFTLWASVPLVPQSGDWWIATLPISSGTHEINVRVDGGPWRVPPGLTPLLDEFGGVVGLLVVP